MAENRKVTIVFPCYNRREITLQCLRSLSRIEREGLDVRVVVVDDGSTDGTAEAVRRDFPEAEIVHGNGNLWYTAGTNRGIEAALKDSPDYILAINDDAVFDAKFLRLMVDCAETHPRSVIGALLLLWDLPHQVFQVAPKWKTWAGGWRHLFAQTVWTMPKTPFEVGLIVGNCVLVPTAAIRECGLMDEKNFINFGDAEWTPRMKKRGWTLLIEPRARIFCQPNTPPTKSLRKMSLRELYQTLWADTGKQQNLRCWFRCFLASAPSKTAAVIAFLTFVGQQIFHAAGFRGRPLPEKPLSEDYV